MHNTMTFTYKHGYEHIELDVIMTGIADFGLELTLIKAKKGYDLLLDDKEATEHTKGCIDALREFLIRHGKLK